MFNALKPWHIAVLVVVLILLFGAKKLPDAARGLGRSLRILKAETKNLRDEAKADDNNTEMDAKAEPQHSRKTIEGDAIQQTTRDKTREDV
ncbi:Sec-independent protein translocase protein TatA [Actinorhabdospora filicis]|uniref:Sec-independent protein translocase protein TatA n=1 Tax=Actinorhabdospora filicis TaxID=1785913 RepID=A0A9W6W9X4_9ACTN|nr:Sec-independent protein translocase subunit TatA [Actinorhabdospora filicis]GLZ79084.1 Sec-independent protein translocase protein TatA [Actinorhabdospora filicis]